jgi:hypothetical protein
MRVDKATTVAVQNGLLQDRRLCADGFIIRAQAIIRADGFRPRKLGEDLRANSGKPSQ